MRDLITELKENGEDFEFYPSTDEILSHVSFNGLNQGNLSVLDIGCGYGTFDKFFEKKRKSESENDGYKKSKPYKKYYVIEKSQILISKLPDYAVIMGTDFYNTTLIDKKVDVIFCNPPYSDFDTWAEKIILEGNFKVAYLVIPERWRENEKIKNALSTTKKTAFSCGSFDFLNAERQARAKVELVKIDYNRFSKVNPFDLWFDETFKVEEKKETVKETAKNALSTGKDKVETLVNLYNDEMSKLCGSYKSICSIDSSVLSDCGVNRTTLKNSLESKISGLKAVYWKLLFSNLEELTKRLTNSTRYTMLEKFKESNCVDFSEENIRAVLIQTIKISNSYYNGQLVEVFKELSDEKNVLPYKSNQRLFQKDSWRWNCENKTDYVLDYRIVLDTYRFVCHNWYEKSILSTNGTAFIEDICTVANNLGFNIGSCDEVKEFGKKYYCYFVDGTEFFEMKVFKKGTIHFKFNVDFTKAMNVEVSRILGWIRNKADIEREFPESFKGAEKYFNTNANFQLQNATLLLTNG